VEGEREEEERREGRKGRKEGERRKEGSTKVRAQRQQETPHYPLSLSLSLSPPATH
jgi:hypothetical protein